MAVRQGTAERSGVVGGVVVDRSGSWQRFSDTSVAPEPMRKRLRAAGGVERNECLESRRAGPHWYTCLLGNTPDRGRIISRSVASALSSPIQIFGLLSLSDETLDGQERAALCEGRDQVTCACGLRVVSEGVPARPELGVGEEVGEKAGTRGGLDEVVGGATWHQGETKQLREFSQKAHRRV